jgi:hypothetical protein
MVHAVLLTPHAKYDTACKILHPMQNMTPHAKYNTACTLTERFEGPHSLYWEYLSKKYMFPNCPTPPLKNYINFKGLPNKKFSG